MTSTRLFLTGYFQHIKSKLFSTSKTSHTLNCWFCNEDCEVKSQEQQLGWTCPHCQQYNGFDEDGDYNYPIHEQHEHSTESKRFCQKGDFKESKSLLCHTCSQNQVLKVGQLASFVPLSEVSYNQEVEAYDGYLNSVYRLCQRCREKVEVYLAKQNEEIMENLDQEDLQIEARRNSNIRPKDGRFLWMSSHICWSKLLFLLCLLMAITNMLFTVRSYLKQKQQRIKASYLQYLIPILPSWDLQNTIHVPVYFGASLCVMALFTVGKTCIYMIDAFHIILWLLLLVCNALALHSLHPGFVALNISSLAYLIFSLATSCVCFVCMKASRLPRNVSQSSFQMSSKHQPVATHQSTTEVKRESQTSPKHNAPKSDEKDLPKSSGKDLSRSFSFTNVSSASSSPRSSPIPAPVGEARNFFKPISSSARESPSSISSISPPIVDAQEKSKSVFETVRHGIESFSLGLGKKSGSMSSVWSLPSVVTSDVPNTPDSTSPTKPPQACQRDILSPSRLSFVSFSLSPSPGKFSSSPFSEPDSGFVPDSSQQRYSTVLIKAQIGKDSVTTRNEPYSTKKTMSPLGYSTPFHVVRKDKNMETWREKNSRKSKSPAKPYKFGSELLTAHVERTLAVPDSSTSNENVINKDQSGPRRSDRIAMRGKIIKPWPLKKSLSLNDMYDRREDINKTRGQSGSDWNPSVDGKSEVKKSGFYAYKSSKVRGSHKKDSSSEGLRKRRFAKNLESIAESSDDDDCEDVDGLWMENKRRILRGESQKTSESRWVWTLFGLVIGVSLTVNAFLTWNLWKDRS